MSTKKRWYTCFALVALMIIVLTHMKTNTEPSIPMTVVELGMLGVLIVLSLIVAFYPGEERPNEPITRVRHGRMDIDTGNITEDDEGE